MLNELNLAIVDLETTGGSAGFDRIIEIGIKRIERGQAVHTYSTLVNPERPIPPMITQLTGIGDRDVADAPTFAQVHEAVLAALQDCVFVAHNVRFDYGFLRQELLRLERPYTAPCLCTVRLSRLLYPGWRHHSLSHVIERFDLPCINRHRALDDAEAVWAFIQHAAGSLDGAQFADALHALLQRPILPPQLPADALDALPDGPGAYIFRDAAGDALYVGKSLDVRDRVADHFSTPYAGVALRVAQEIARIETRPAYGELGALLIEAHLLATLHPRHNRRRIGRREPTAAYEASPRDGYATVRLAPLGALDTEQAGRILGVFPHVRAAMQSLRQLAARHQLCPSLLGLERSRTSCRPAATPRCGACSGQLSPEHHHTRLLEAFGDRRVTPWPFDGPIVVEERAFDGRRGHAFILDEWRLLRALAYEEDAAPEEFLPRQDRFEYDRYAQLAAFLARRPRGLRRLPPAQARQLLSDDPACEPAFDADPAAA